MGTKEEGMFETKRTFHVKKVSAEKQPRKKRKTWIYFSRCINSLKFGSGADL